MIARGQHHTVERRVLPPRRSDMDRRIAERRLEVISLEAERREQVERRQLTDRRGPAGRRQVEPGHHDKLAVLVVSDQDDEARRGRGPFYPAPPHAIAAAALRPATPHAP